MKTMPQTEKTVSRRDALKTLAAATGAATLMALPGKWETPLVEMGTLPAHAQCSGPAPEINRVSASHAGSGCNDPNNFRGELFLVTMTFTAPAGAIAYGVNAVTNVFSDSWGDAQDQGDSPSITTNFPPSGQIGVTTVSGNVCVNVDDRGQPIDITVFVTDACNQTTTAVTSASLT